MNKPEIRYYKRPNADGRVDVYRSVNGFSIGPFLTTDEETANRIVFFDDMISALNEAQEIIKMKTGGTSFAIESVLKRAGVS